MLSCQRNQYEVMNLVNHVNPVDVVGLEFVEKGAEVYAQRLILRNHLHA